jgi:hypothetical protein
MIINEMAKSFFNNWENAVHEQQQYMRQNLFIGEMKLLTFIERLKRMNKFLRYFLRERVFGMNNVEIDEEQLISLMYHEPHGIMQLQIQRAGRSINEFQTLDELKVFFSQQHDCDQLEARILKAEKKGNDSRKSKNKKNNKKRKSKPADDDADNAEKDLQKKPAAAKISCTHCGKVGHKSDNCWTLEKNANKRPANFRTANTIAKKKAPKAAEEAHFTQDQVSEMMKTVMASMKKKYGLNENREKRQVRFEDDNNNSSDNDSERVAPYTGYTMYFFDNIRSMEAPSQKRQKVAHYCAEIIVEIIDSNNHIVPIRALLDTGMLETILLKPFVAPNSPKGYEGKPVTWKTLGGNFITHHRAKVQFAFPELGDKKSVTWVVHVDKNTDPTKTMYDMIIGMDCMCSLGIHVNTDEKVITWEGNTIPLKERGQLQDTSLLNYLYSLTVDMSEVLLEAEECQSRLLDATYERLTRMNLSEA